jgi:hypothetical protein
MLALAATGPVSRWFTLFHVVSSDFGGFCILFVSLSGWWFQRSFIFHNKKGLSSSDSVAGCPSEVMETGG